MPAIARLSLSLLLSTLFLSQCTLGPQNPATLTLDSAPTSLGLESVTQDSARRLLELTQEGLVKLENGKPVPALAEKWETSGNSIRFSLRAAKWSDGVAIVGSDFLTSWQRIRERRELAPKYLEGILSMKSPSASELVIETVLPPDQLLMRLADPVMAPVPSQNLVNHSLGFSDGINLRATGKYQITKYQPGIMARLDRNPYYYERGISPSRVLVEFRKR